MKHVLSAFYPPLRWEECGEASVGDIREEEVESVVYFDQIHVLSWCRRDMHKRKVRALYFSQTFTQKTLWLTFAKKIIWCSKSISIFYYFPVFCLLLCFNLFSTCLFACSRYSLDLNEHKWPQICCQYLLFVVNFYPILFILVVNNFPFNEM